MEHSPYTGRSRPEGWEPTRIPWPGARTSPLRSLNARRSRLKPLSLLPSQHEIIDMLPTNAAAYIDSPGSRPLVVKQAPYPTATPRSVVIMTRAIAINPADIDVQLNSGSPKTGYPLILGSDVAGQIVEIGEGVEGFTVGRRVVAHSGYLSDEDSPATGTFQTYVRAPAGTTAVILPDLTYEDAVVVPTALSTASTALYARDKMGLPHMNTRLKRRINGEGSQTIFVWGGDTSIGSMAVQLLQNTGAGGYLPWTTARKENHHYVVHEIFAREVFDLPAEPKKVARKVKDKLGFHCLYGIFDAISTPESLAACGEIARLCAMACTPAVIGVSPLEEIEDYEDRGVTYRFVTSTKVHSDSGFGREVFSFLGDALAGELPKMRCMPKPNVVGKGLESLQTAMDEASKGESATKIVVTI